MTATDRIRRILAPVARPLVRHRRAVTQRDSATGPPDFVGVGAQRYGTTWFSDADVLLGDTLQRCRSGLSYEVDRFMRSVSRRRREYAAAMTANDALDRSLYGSQLRRLLDQFAWERVLLRDPADLKALVLEIDLGLWASCRGIATGAGAGS